MSSWGKVDQYEDAPLWALAAVNLEPVASNMGSAGSGKLFENETLSNLISGVKIGLFNYAATEQIAGTHTGWVMKVEGSGGRNGRTYGETLVCLTSNS